MKYAFVIAAAVLVGLHWQSDFGWFLVAIGAIFIIHLLKNKEYEQKNREDQR